VKGLKIDPFRFVTRPLPIIDPFGFSTRCHHIGHGQVSNPEESIFRHFSYPKNSVLFCNLVNFLKKGEFVTKFPFWKKDVVVWQFFEKKKTVWDNLIFYRFIQKCWRNFLQFIHCPTFGSISLHSSIVLLPPCSFIVPFSHQLPQIPWQSNLLEEVGSNFTNHFHFPTSSRLSWLHKISFVFQLFKNSMTFYICWHM